MSPPPAYKSSGPARSEEICWCLDVEPRGEGGGGADPASRFFGRLPIRSFGSGVWEMKWGVLPLPAFSGSARRETPLEKWRSFGVALNGMGL